MFVPAKRIFVLSLFIVSSLVATALGQGKPGDGTAAQRIEVMGQRLTIMRRSLTSAASVLKDENKGDKSKKDDKDKLDTPLGRLLSLEKEAARLQSEVNSLSG